MQFQISSKRETGKEIPESSRLESLEKFSANNFALSDSEDYTSVDNTIGNLPKASRVKFPGSNVQVSYLSTLPVLPGDSWFRS